MVRRVGREVGCRLPRADDPQKGGGSRSGLQRAGKPPRPAQDALQNSTWSRPSGYAAQRTPSTTSPPSWVLQASWPEEGTQPLGVEGPTDPHWARSQQASAHHPAEGRTEEVQQEEAERVDKVGLRWQTGNSHFIRTKL